MIDTVYVNPSPPKRGESFTVSTTITLSKLELEWYDS